MIFKLILLGQLPEYFYTSYQIDMDERCITNRKYVHISHELSLITIYLKQDIVLMDKFIFEIIN